MNARETNENVCFRRCMMNCQVHANLVPAREEIGISTSAPRRLLRQTVHRRAQPNAETVTNGRKNGVGQYRSEFVYTCALW